MTPIPADGATQAQTVLVDAADVALFYVFVSDNLLSLELVSPAGRRRYRATETNPVDLVRADTPAFLFLHGDDDLIIPPAQTLALHQALREAGADSIHHLLAGAGHGILSLNRRQARQWTSVQVLTLITEFLDRTLRG